MITIDGMKKIKITRVVVVLLLLLGFNLSSTNVFAEDKNDLSFTMAIKPLENQIDKKLTYYDLLVTPGQEQVLTVIVTNTGSDLKKIDVTPTNAITNQNGVIDYSKQEKTFKNDPTLKHPFTSLVGESQTVEVAAGESKEVEFDLRIPEEPFEGTILGGFLVDLNESDQKEEQAANGVKIVNRFQLVKAVRLRENKEKVSSELVLNDVKPALVSYRTAVTANLQNTEPTMFGSMKVEAEITKKGQSEVLKSVTKEGLEMVPNSNFDFPIMWGSQRLAPGKYTLNMVASSGSRKWQFSEDFTITAEESNKINKEAVDLEEEKTSYWLYIAIAALILLIILILSLLIYFYKKNKNEKEEERKRRIRAKKKNDKGKGQRKAKERRGE